MARSKEKVLQFKVLLEQDEKGMYVASVPELPGCYTQGKTLEEVRKRIKEVIQLVLEEDKGSHVRLRHPDGRVTTIPFHVGEKVGIGLLRKILRDVHISRVAFEKLR